MKPRIKKKGMTYYLAGPMSGIPQFNFPAFFAAQKVLEKKGYTIVSPAEMDDNEDHGAAMASPDGAMGTGTGGLEKTWGEFLARDVQMIADTDINGIILLPEWETSKGARLEVFVCINLGYPVLFYDVGEFSGQGQLIQFTYERVLGDIYESLL